jgi:archaellum biogenesis ATPase FlaH
MNQFELNLLGSILQRNRMDLLDPEMFQDEIVRSISFTIQRLFTKNSVIPDSTAVKLESMGSLPSGREPEELEEAVTSLDKNISNTDYYLDKAKEYREVTRLNRAIQAAQIGLTGGDIPLARSCLLEALREHGTSSDRGYGDGLERRLDRYRRGDGISRIPTGFPTLDKVTRGGLGTGELGVIVGLAKGGKSTLLVNIGAAAMIHGKSVLHVSLENSKDLTEEKYDSRFTGLTPAEILNDPGSLESLVSHLGPLRVLYRPMKTLDCSGLLGLTQLYKPDILLVDYAARMRAASHRTELRFELAEIFEGLRKIAGVCGIPVWTAHQANRPNPEFPSDQIGMERISECFEVAGVVDLAISVNQSDQEEIEDMGRIFVMANRIGEGGSTIQIQLQRGICRAHEPNSLPMITPPPAQGGLKREGGATSSPPSQESKPDQIVSDPGELDPYDLKGLL